MNRSLPQYYILLADDDDDDFLFFYNAIAEVAPYVTLKRATDGVHLMKLLTESVHIPKLLFLDINMPRKSGFQCLQEIRAIKRFQSMPIVMISTTQDPKIIETLTKAGANRYICKPNNFPALKAEIDQALYRYLEPVAGLPELFPNALGK